MERRVVLMHSGRNECKRGKGETMREREKNGGEWHCGGQRASTLVISHHQWQWVDATNIGGDVDGKEKWKMKDKEGKEMKGKQENGGKI